MVVLAPNFGQNLVTVSGFSFLVFRKTKNHTPKTRFTGGADRDRTGDPLLAKQVLSQLSYSPLKAVSGFWFWVSRKTKNEKPATRSATRFLVGLGRVELPTSPLSGVRSSQLSYRPGLFPDTYPNTGFEDKVERACRLRRHGPSRNVL